MMALTLDTVGAFAAQTPPDPKSTEAAAKFEAYMVAFLAQQMRQSVPEGPFSQGPAATFAGLFDQEIGRRVAEGDGFGLKGQLAAALATAGVDVAPPPPRAYRTGPVTPHVGVAAGSVPPRLAAGDDHDHGHPVEGARVTSRFGLRQDPFTHELRGHAGTDFGAAQGTEIRAAAEGVVRFAGERGGYGKLVIVDHADGTETRYAHCAALRVQAGETIPKDAVVGTVGQTGRATGPHLHFEVRKDGVAMDPEAWLRGR
jgi:murein DD-endopeptidase MepM/ murein hydrolase activator NlpD